MCLFRHLFTSHGTSIYFYSTHLYGKKKRVLSWPRLSKTKCNSHKSTHTGHCNPHDETIANTTTTKQETTTKSQPTKRQALEVERQTTRLALNIRADMPAPLVVEQTSGRRTCRGQQDFKLQMMGNVRRGLGFQSLLLPLLRRNNLSNYEEQQRRTMIHI